MKVLRPSAKNANHVSTTAFNSIDNQLSKNRCVGFHARQRMNSGPMPMMKVRNTVASVTTNTATHRNATDPMEKMHAARTRSSRVMPASFMMSATCMLALSLNSSRRLIRRASPCLLEHWTAEMSSRHQLPARSRCRRRSRCRSRTARRTPRIKPIFVTFQRKSGPSRTLRCAAQPIRTATPTSSWQSARSVRSLSSAQTRLQARRC